MYFRTFFYIISKVVSSLVKTGLRIVGSSHMIVKRETSGIADQEDPMGKSFHVLAGKDVYLTAGEIMVYVVMTGHSRK